MELHAKAIMATRLDRHNSPNLSLIENVNPHYLNRLMTLADTAPVLAIEDIFDARGVKLLAKGAHISRNLQEKLILHKLQKPLESSLMVEGGIDSHILVQIAERLIDTNIPLAKVLRTTCADGFNPISTLSNMKFGNSMTMMLTIADKGCSKALEHAVITSLLSICMTRKARLSEQDQQVSGLAGMLHDIGESYIDPIYLSSTKHFLPHEWGHFVVHPRIGQMLINDCKSYPAAVGRAVSEHHERYDGSGYPRQISGDGISVPGQFVAISELIASLMVREYPIARSELAIKIFPGEHAHGVLSVISEILRVSRVPLDGETPAPTDGRDENLKQLNDRISSSLACARSLFAGSHAMSPSFHDMLKQTIGRIEEIQRAFVSTGMDVYVKQSLTFNDDADRTILFEKEVATREFQWRLRGIARGIAMRCVAKDDAATFSSLIRLLDERAERVIEPEVLFV